MFGYLAPVLNVLSKEQRDRYQSAYCSICRSLKRYGEGCRLGLSHDMTFLLLMLTSLYSGSIKRKRSRCALHPIHPRDWFQSDWADYCSDMNLLLFYYKCEDNKIDEGDMRSKCMLSALERPCSKIREKYPVQAREIVSALHEIWKYEKKSDFSPDLLCNLSGRMLASVFVPDPEDIWASELYCIGESLGRFIYWMDAYEDYEQDCAKKRFNPLTAFRSRADYEQFCLETLEMFASEAVSHFEALPIMQNRDLIRHILYSGIWQRYLRSNQRKKEAAV